MATLNEHKAAKGKSQMASVEFHSREESPTLAGDKP